SRGRRTRSARPPATRAPVFSWRPPTGVAAGHVADDTGRSVSCHAARPRARHGRPARFGCRPTARPGQGSRGQMSLHTKRMTVSGTELAYDEWGHGDPLVCLHGGMGIDSAYLKVPGVTGLAGGGRRVVVYDQRGHGASGRSAPREYTHARWAQD